MPVSATPGDAARFREALGRAGYNETNLVELLGALEMPTRRARNQPRLVRASQGDSDLHLAAQLFFLGLPLRQALAERALQPVPLGKWVKAGLVRVARGVVRSPIRLVPFSGLILASDPPELVERGARQDIVIGMTGSSLALVCAAVRRRCGSALDVGTGCGVQALLAAGHADRVLATDRSARAIRFARFNAALNGRANIEFRTGDTFRPVRGRRFDLIVCNPPFMISPGLRYMYRDGGLEGDGFCRQLARQAPVHLNDGGYFQMTCEWVHPVNGDWQERLAAWFAGSGCDALVLRARTQSPAAYADEWIRDTEKDDPKLWGRLYGEFLDYYKRLGIQAISTGTIAMRRRPAAANRVRFDDLPSHQPEPIGEVIARAFESGDALERLRDDRALLAQRLRLSPDVRLEQQLQCQNGAWRVVGARLVLVRGIRFFGEVDEHAARLVARFNGQAPLADVVAAMAAELKVSFEAVAEPSLVLVRQLIERGFLIPDGVEG